MEFFGNNNSQQTSFKSMSTGVNNSENNKFSTLKQTTAEKKPITPSADINEIKNINSTEKSHDNTVEKKNDNETVKTKVEEKEKKPMETNETVTPKEETPKKSSEYIELKRYDDIEKKVKKAIEDGDSELILFLNELTLGRNLEETFSKSRTIKHFSAAPVVLKKADGTVIKRAGIYNKQKHKDADYAEDVVINEVFDDPDVLTIHRNSPYLKRFM